LNNRNDLLIWLTEVFDDWLTPDYILMGGDHFGFRPQITFNDGNIVSVQGVPHTAIRKKYRLVSNEVPLHYYENINLIRKLENLLDRKYIITHQPSNQYSLVNLSNVRFDKRANQTLFEEDYIIHYMSNGFQSTKIRDPFFFELLDNLLTQEYVIMLLDKKFSELNNDELNMVKIYHYK